MESYRKLAVASTVNTLVMFLITYAMIASADHFYANLNRAYMAVMMAAPMVIVMLIVMRSMFQNRGLNAGLIVAMAALFGLTLGFVRTQTPIGDTQFLRSMIPHHSGAIVMCREANLTDPEIEKLCGQIIESQEREIAEMKALLARR